MNRINTIFSIITFSFTINLGAQELIKHVVKKGETVYHLSKQYNVDITVIYAHNPEAKTAIHVGETLTFPGNNNTTNIEPETQDGYLIHTVSVGETKFGLSRYYNISISQLEDLNPQIVTMLQAGHKLRIPNNGNTPGNLIIVKPRETLYAISKRYRMTVDELICANTKRVHIIIRSGQTLFVGKGKQAKTAGESAQPQNVPTTNQVIEKDQLPKEEAQVSTKNTSDKFVDYTIQPKETLFSLSKKAGMTADELTILNPQLKSRVLIGMVIKMPENSVQQNDIAKTDVKKTETELIKNETRNETENELTKKNTEVTEAIPSSNLQATLVKNVEKTLFFVTPFNETEFKKFNSSTQTLDKNLKDQIDFLKGSLLAVEKAKAQGLKLKTQFLKSKEIETQKALEDKIKKEANAVILTSDRKEDETLIKEYSATKIPVIIAQPENEYLNSENIFNSLPTLESQRTKILEFLKNQKGHVTVVQDMDAIDLEELISKYFPAADYVTASKNGNLDTDELIESLSKTETNFVIMNTAKSGIVLSSTTALLKEVYTHKIQLVILETDKVPDSEKVSSNRLKILRMLYPSTQIDPSKSNDFIEEYYRQNSQKPSSQLLKGYDVTSDTILRLFQSKTFKELAESAVTEQLTLKFDYDKNESGSFSNSGINILQFDESGNAKIIK